MKNYFQANSHLFLRCIAIIFAVIGSLQMRGQSLVEFNASLLSGAATELPVASVAANLSSTSITRTNLTATSVSGAFASSLWAMSPSTAPSSNKYLAFTLTPASGYVLNLNGATLSFDLRRSGSGPNAVHIYSSVAGFASSANELATVTPIVSSGGTAVNYVFPSSGYNELLSIQIRIYGDQANSTGGILRLMNPGAGGNIRISGGSVSFCPSTQLANGYCGITLTALNQNINCVAVTGATNYQYKFMQGATIIATYIRGNYLTNCNLSLIAQIKYGQTYQVQVRPFVSGAWRCYGNSCNVTTPAFPAGQVAPISCGTSPSSFNTLIYCNTVIGATNYEWKFMQGASIIATYQRGNWLTDMQLKNVVGITYGQVYDVYVRAKRAGVWGPYGTSCTITTPPFPTTQVSPTWCNGSVTNLSSGLTCDPLLGASNYRWKVQNGSFVSVGYRGNSETNWRISWNAGTTINTTYDVSISAYVGGVWGPYGPICTVTVGPYYLPQHEDENVALPPEVRIANPEMYSNESLVTLDIYPNPFSDNITVSTDVTVTILIIYNSFGELVRTVEIENGKTEINLSDLSVGIYLIQAQTASGTITKRVIKQ